MAQYRKVPLLVEAFCWTADIEQIEDPLWIIDALKQGRAIIRTSTPGRLHMLISAPNGWMTAKPGDWIVKDSHGLYPCTPEIFAACYEVAE